MQAPAHDQNDLGDHQPETTGDASKPEEPEPQVQATLLGTISDTDASMARAWVHVDGEQRMLREGDPLTHGPDAPVVAEIQPTFIRLTSHEDTFTLDLADDSVFAKRTDASSDNAELK
ncbi:hypothetical protein [Crateriforma conspicua]|nr:hypothetical protein [Crateriforma conspicua]